MLCFCFCVCFICLKKNKIKKKNKKTVNRNWWKFTPERAKLIKVKRKVRRMLKEDPIPGLKPLYNRLNKIVRGKINEQKQDKWKEFVSGIEAETNVATFWKNLSHIAIAD